MIDHSRTLIGLGAFQFPSSTRRFARTGSGNLSTQHICSREIASDFVQEIAKLVGSKPAGRVLLLGCEHIELLIQLAQHGFVDVTCCRVLAGPHAAESSADIIIAPAVDREPEFPAVLSRLTRGLRPDGVLIFGTAGALMIRGLRLTRLSLKSRRSSTRNELPNSLVR